ncbi:MAG: cupin domain-containing protein [Christensenellales bacterium]
MDEFGIGQQLRQHRLDKGLSQKQVSKAADISISLLSQIERGNVNPSINTLIMICKVIDIPLYSLFLKEQKTQNPVVKRHERRLLGQMSGDDTTYELLTPDTTGNIEFCIMRIPPQSETVKHAQSHNTEEVAYVLEGKVAIELNNEIYVLDTGDSVRIEALQIHKWINPYDVPAVIIFAISPPSF